MTHVTHDQREIESITFGVYSPEEILRMSVCKVDNTKNNGHGSVYDPRMGTTDSSQSCETCKQNAIECPGHMGYIELNEPIVHPMYYKRVTMFLNCICMRCYRLLITQDQLYLTGLNRYRGEARFNQLVEKLKKVDICCQPTSEVDEDDEFVLCRKDKPKIKFIAGDSSYSMVYLDGKKNKTSIALTVEEIKKIFDNIPDEDVRLMGFDPELSHPRNFIISYLSVCPPATRPFVKADGKLCDDDLTISYKEILKANANLVDEAGEEERVDRRGRKKKPLTDQDRVKARASLRFRISTMMNNSSGRAKHSTNGRAIKGLKERLAGKGGQVRSNMMGEFAQAVLKALLVLRKDACISKSETAYNDGKSLQGASPL